MIILRNQKMIEVEMQETRWLFINILLYIDYI